MNNSNRPHGRDKTVSSGSANVGRGEQVNTGSRPVGGNARPSQPSQKPNSSPSSSQRPASQRGILFGGSGGSSTGGTPSSGGGSKLKLFLAVIVIVLVVLFALRFCGGERLSLSDYLGAFGSIDSGSSSLGSWDTASSYTTTTPSVTESAGNNNNADLSVSSLAREKRVKLKGDGSDTVTIMVYMCGTDLESQYGMATSDLKEMLAASLSDKVNLLIETGGCKKWKNNVISNTTNQIYQVKNGSLVCLEDRLGAKTMTESATLTEFIRYCSKNFPADRNILILWDHGGGTISGYGYDEKAANSGSMTLTKLNKALSDGGCIFDWIGFDACLMATFETALVANQYADYLIASEETEPGTGWYYTNWLNKISENTATSTVVLGKTLIDDYIAVNQRSYGSSAKATLSLCDLAELQGTVPSAFHDFSISTCEMVKGDAYATVSNVRASVRQFSPKNKLNQIDLIDFAKRLNTRESAALAEALSGCIKYNKTNLSNANGLSIYFPYESLKSLNSAVAMYDALGIDDDYTACIKSFASMESGGQTVASASQSSLFSPGFSSSSSSSAVSSDLLSSLLGGFTESYSAPASSYGSSSSAGGLFSALPSLLGAFSNTSGEASSGMTVDASDILSLLSAFSGRSMPSSLSWMDADLIASSAQKIADNSLDPGRITVTEKNGKKVLALTEEEWSLIQTIELNVYADDGSGFIDLGLDNVFEWNEDNDLILDYDGTWLTLNGNTAAYYMVSDVENSDGSWTTSGRIPAMLNEQLVDLNVVFDSAHPQGAVIGASPMYADETETLAKENIEIVAGDTIQLICDYYTYDGQYIASYALSDAFTVDSTGLKLTNLTLTGDGISFNVTYRLTDIYGNYYWTPAFVK